MKPSKIAFFRVVLSFCVTTRPCPLGHRKQTQKTFLITTKCFWARDSAHKPINQLNDITFPFTSSKQIATLIVDLYQVSVIYNLAAAKFDAFYQETPS